MHVFVFLLTDNKDLVMSVKLIMTCVYLYIVHGTECHSCFLHYNQKLAMFSWHIMHNN